VRHAGDATLDNLEAMLEQLRRHSQLVEKKRGVFYRKSRAFLHFHEDPAGFFCDARLDPDADFERFPVTTDDERRDVLKRVADALA
jgi:hypothetical protein